MTLDGVEHRVREGDALVVPAGVEFAVAAAGPEPFRAVVCLPVGGQAVLPGGEPFTPPWASDGARRRARSSPAPPADSAAWMSSTSPLPTFAFDADDPEGFRSGMLRLGPRRRLAGRRVGLRASPGPGRLPVPLRVRRGGVADRARGHAELRTPEGERALAPWDVVCFPSGPAGAHQVRNDAATAGARADVRRPSSSRAITVYPDSGKVGAWTGNKADDAAGVQVEQGRVLRRRAGNLAAGGAEVPGTKEDVGRQLRAFCSAGADVLGVPGTGSALLHRAWSWRENAGRSWRMTFPAPGTFWTSHRSALSRSARPEVSRDFARSVTCLTRSGSAAVASPFRGSGGCLGSRSPSPWDCSRPSSSSSPPRPRRARCCRCRRSAR